MKTKGENRKQLKKLNKFLLNLSAEIIKAGNFSAHKLDFYILSAINRAISLNKAFILLIDEKNSLTAISIVRLQLDNAIRLHAVNVAENPESFLDHFFDGKPINKFKQGKDNFTDKFLVTKLNDENPGALDLYNYLCDFIHFSDKHFHAAQTESTNPDASFRFVIGNSDILKENEKHEFYDRMIQISNSIAKKGVDWIKLKNVIL